MPVEIASIQTTVTTQPVAGQLNTLDERGNFNQISVAQVPKPEDCGTQFMSEKIGFCIGICGSGAIAIAGVGLVPWTVWSLGKTLTLASSFSFGVTGALPGLACVAGTTAWFIKDKKALVNEN